MDDNKYNNPRGFSVVFNDEFVVVVDKTAKLLVHPSPKKERITLTSILKGYLNTEVFPCHRLDRETTGLIIYAYSRDAQELIMEQFRERKVKKKYYALVRGYLKKYKGVFSGKVLDREGEKFREKAKTAKTFYRVKKTFKDFSLLELEPVTGRTNQLRIQLARSGNPILGEDKYALRRDFRINFRRLALHAFFISFYHPVSKDRVEVKVNLPGDMENFIREKGRII